MFDVGITEVLLLAIIGLLVLGPERLPRVARTLGGLTRKARSSWMNLKRSIDAEINAEEIRKPVQKMHSDVRSAMDGVDKKLKEAGASVNSTLSAKVGGVAPGATPGPASKSAAADSKAAESQPPANDPK